MRIVLALGGFTAATLLAAQPVLGQDPDLKSLKRELELLKRENDLLKRENDLLKQELAALKKGAKATPADANEPIAATAGNVEYVYKGTTRNGADMFVTLLMTSKSGDNRTPTGVMTLIDGEGNKYTGMPQGGFGAAQVLREGVPLKMTWRFGPNPLTKQGTAPSAKIATFASLTVDADVGGGRTAVEFRDVPAVLPLPKKK